MTTIKLAQKQDEVPHRVTLGAMTIANVTLPIASKDELQRLIAKTREADVEHIVQRLRAALDAATFAQVMRALE